MKTDREFLAIHLEVFCIYLNALMKDGLTRKNGGRVILINPIYNSLTERPNSL